MDSAEAKASSSSSWSSKARKRYLNSSHVFPDYGPVSSETSAVPEAQGRRGLRFVPPVGPVNFSSRRTHGSRRQGSPPAWRRRRGSPPWRIDSPPVRQASPSSSRKRASPPARETSPHPSRRQASPPAREVVDGIWASGFGEGGVPDGASPPSQPAPPPRRQVSPPQRQNSLRRSMSRPNLVGLQTIVTVNVHTRRSAIKRENGDSESHKRWPFPVHKNHLCHYSTYFDQAVNGPMELEEIDLYGTDSEIFGMFVNWLYTQDIVDKDGETPDPTSLVCLWMLGDKIQAPALQNQVMDQIEIVRIDGFEIGSHLFPKIYENTKEDAPLRLYIVELCSATWLPAIENAEHYPPQLLVDIINTIRSRAAMKEQLVTEDMQRFYVPEEEGDTERGKRRRTR